MRHFPGRASIHSLFPSASRAKNISPQPENGFSHLNSLEILPTNFTDLTLYASFISCGFVAMYEGEDGFPAAKRRRLESGGEYIDTTHLTTDFWDDGDGTAVECSSQSLQLFAGSGSSLMANDAMDCDDPLAYSMDQDVSQDMIDVADKDETNEDSRMNVCFGVVSWYSMSQEA